MIVKTPKGQNKERAIITAIDCCGSLNRDNCKGWGFTYRAMMSYFYNYFQPVGFMIQEWRDIPFSKTGGKQSNLVLTEKGRQYYIKEGLISDVPQRGWTKTKPKNLLDVKPLKGDVTKVASFSITNKEVFKLTLGELVKLLNAGTDVCVQSMDGYIANGDFSDDKYYNKLAGFTVKNLKIEDNLLIVTLNCTGGDIL